VISLASVQAIATAGGESMGLPVWPEIYVEVEAVAFVPSRRRPVHTRNRGFAAAAV